MASPIEALLILCDAAQADPSGKLHMLGAGWSLTGSPTAISAVAVMLKIPWDRTNQQLPLILTLETEDGKPVEIPTPEGDRPLRHEASIEVGRPPGLKAGVPLDAAMAFTIPPLPLAPGRYQWRLEVGGNIFLTAFGVRP